MKPLLICSLFILSGHLLAQTKSQYDLAIENVNVIPCNENTLLYNKTVLIKDNRIVAILDRKQVSAKTIVDGKGKYLIPGLADMHVHLPDKGHDNFFNLSLAAGVIYLRSMRGDAGNFNHIKFRDSLAKNNPYAPYLILSAPPFYKGDGIKNADSLILQYKMQGYDFVKILSVQSQIDFDEIMRASNKYKIKVAGHNPVPLLKTLGSGFGCIEHLGGYIPYLKNDSLNFAIEKTIQNNVYNCATLDWYSIAYLQPTKAELHKRAGLQHVSNRQLTAWDSAYDASLTQLKQLDSAKRKTLVNQYQDIMRAKYSVLKKLYDHNAKMILGADASGLYQLPGYSVYDEMYLYKKAGVSNYQILRTATFSAAEYCGKADEWGSINAGKLANLVLLSKNPLEQIENIDSVEGIVINGQWLDKHQLTKRVK